MVAFDVLWLSTNPSLKRFDLPLINYLSNSVRIGIWEYKQGLDEGSCIEKAVVLLYDFIKSSNHKFHLIGHGINGAIALLFARSYPQRVQTLTLLSVAYQAGYTWHVYYYNKRYFLNISRERVLIHTAQTLFGNQIKDYSLNSLILSLDMDLDHAPSHHSLYKTMNLVPGNVDVPLMVCSSQNDAILTDAELGDWLKILKSGDIFWQCESGNHFFHFFYPEKTGKNILNFWRNHYPDILQKPFC